MTTSAVVQMYLFIHIGLILVATAYFAVSAAVAPGLAARSRARIAARPWGTVFVGALVSVPWVFVAVSMIGAPPAAAKFGGAALMTLWVLCGLIGGAGIAQHIGAGDEPEAGWGQTVRGGLLISLTWILPIAGWLVALPLTLAAGIGCLVMGMFGSKSAVPATV